MNSNGTIFLNLILQSWGMLLHTGFTELHIFFVTRSTTIFSSTVFLVRNFHACNLSNKEAVLLRCTLKKLFSVKP